MKRNMQTAILLLLFAFLLPARASAQGTASITANSVRNHLEFLASDAMRGRDTPSAELDSCAFYIAAHFQQYGLEPAGGNETFFQTFNLTRNTLGSPNSCVIHTDGSSEDFTLKDDFVPMFLTANKKTTAPVVFAGYGITAPEFGYDDYEHIDAAGKIVFIFTHEPQENDTASVFHAHRLSEHSDVTVKAMNAIRHGAVGMILVTDPNNHRFRRPPNPWPSLLRNAPEDAVPLSFEEKVENKIVAVRVGKELAETLIAPAGTTLSALQTAIDGDLTPRSLDIPGITVSIETSLNYSYLPTQNVIGMLQGTDPVLRDEYIAVGAHYDHLGVQKDTVIYNGADDNASGTAGVIALAKAFSGENVSRSILFCAWAGEEKGLFGSRYYVDSAPLVPLEQTVSYFNMDMIGRMDSSTVRISGIPSGDIFREIIDTVNSNAGLNIEERKGVSRSDHAPFFNKGIPVLGFDTDFHPDYHEPSDTVEKCSIDGMVKVIRMVYSIAKEVADRDTAPVFQGK